MDLKSILENYEKNLCTKTFQYELNNKWKIDLNFYTQDFCHLLGIQHVHIKDKRYIGQNGYNLIKENKVTIETLKRQNAKGYNFIKGKIEHFNEILNMMSNCNIVKFYEDRVTGKCTKVSAEFTIYYKGKEVLLHLFMRKDTQKLNGFVPVSFIVISQNDKRVNRYIEKQEHKKITNFNIIEK